MNSLKNTNLLIEKITILRQLFWKFKMICFLLLTIKTFPSLHCLTLTQFIILCHDFYLACYGYTSLKCSGFHFWILNFGLVIALCLFGVAMFLFQSLRYFSNFGFWVSGFDLSGVDRSESMAPLSALRQTGQPAPGTIPTIPTMPRCKLSSSTSPSSWWDNVPRKKCRQVLTYPTIRVELINLRSCKLDLPLGFCFTKNAEFSIPNAIVSWLVWFEFLSPV